MEQLIHYVWKHKLFPLTGLKTTDGQEVEVIDTGLHNHNAGPDFFNAKVKIGGTLWVGNVEIHDRASDWFLHRHDRDPNYNNVILHVAESIDVDVKTRRGDYPPQMRLQVPTAVREHYEELLTTDEYPACYRIIPSLSRLMVHSWMSALQTERLEQKTEAIAQRVKDCDGSWEAAYFVTLARNYGFGINGDAFETWAKLIPLQNVAHHRDNLMQIEAFFLGQAGLLDTAAIPERYQQQALNDSYFTELKSEYQYLAHKFGLQAMDANQWRFLRLRPQNFPHIRIAQLAHLYYEQRAGLSQLLECESVKKVRELLATQVTHYWETHYVFGEESAKSEKKLSAASLNLQIINTVAPILFAYGKHKNAEKYCERAFDFLETLKAEENHIVRMWKEVGLIVETAGDSQALIQLKKEYCDRKDCLRCRIGYEYLKGSSSKKG
nr:DUF2851 family protein [uncultured Prevotella sp.]